MGSEAAQLQDFAETCNHSDDEAQIHLVLLTHKEVQGYASALPQSYQQEWSRIEGRFQQHNISTDPEIAYQLIKASLYDAGATEPNPFIKKDELDGWVKLAENHKFFAGLELGDLRELLTQTWPLDPISVFALAHVSNRIAQNERTMFTFLTSEDPLGLRNIIESRGWDEGDTVGSFLISLSNLWDYFEDSVRNDIGGIGAHKYWQGVIHALDKVDIDDHFARSLIKSLGILSLCAETTQVRPTTEVLSAAIYAFDPDLEADVATTLDYLRRRKVIIHRQIDGYWTFITGSDIDFEAELARVIEQVNPTLNQLRHLLELYSPPPYTLARRYNQIYSMTRYFAGVYRWADELQDVPWDLLIDELKSDGLVVYVLAKNDLEWERSIKSIQNDERIIFVVPRKSQQSLLSLEDNLKELFALQEINEDPKLRNHDDRDRVQREIDWLIEDAEAKLERNISSLVDPRIDGSTWVTVKNNTVQGYDLSNNSQAEKIVSQICSTLYQKTPKLNSEGLIRHSPTSQQVRASETVMNAMFSRVASENLGISGSGPDVLILKSILVRTGLLANSDGENWAYSQPNLPELHEMWQLIQNFLDGSNTPTPIEPLIEELTSAPFGLRRGVLPLLLAAGLRSRLKVSTVWKGRQPIDVISGKILTDIVYSPEDYSIEVGQWKSEYDDLWQVLLNLFGNYILDNEYDHHPLAMISNALIRWLQALPTFCRDTNQLSVEALAFRKMMRQAIREPSKAIFEILPSIIKLDARSNQKSIFRSIDGLMQELNNAYLELQRRLELFIQDEFGFGNLSQSSTIALKTWLLGVVGNENQIESFKFGSLIAQDFIEVVGNLNDGDAQNWDGISEAVLGVSLRDWNDESENRFKDKIRTIKTEVERDVEELVQEDKAISFSLDMPNSGKQDFRFRSSDLSSQGQRILQNFKSTMEVAGRPLPIDERRKVALAFLIHIMGDEIGS